MGEERGLLKRNRWLDLHHMATIYTIKRKHGCGPYVGWPSDMTDDHVGWKQACYQGQCSARDMGVHGLYTGTLPHPSAHTAHCVRILLMLLCVVRHAHVSGPAGTGCSNFTCFSFYRLLFLPEFLV